MGNIFEEFGLFSISNLNLVFINNIYPRKRSQMLGTGIAIITFAGRSNGLKRGSGPAEDCPSSVNRKNSKLAFKSKSLPHSHGSDFFRSSNDRLVHFEIYINLFT